MYAAIRTIDLRMWQCNDSCFRSLMADPIPIPNQDAFHFNCVIEDEYKLFPVTMGRDYAVSELKKVIQSEARHALKDIDPHTLELWTVSAIDDLRCEVTLLFSAQGPYRCEASKDFGWTHRVPGRSFGICGHIRTYGQRLRYLFNVASQRSHSHNCAGPGHWWVRSDLHGWALLRKIFVILLLFVPLFFAVRIHYVSALPNLSMIYHSPLLVPCKRPPQTPEHSAKRHRLGENETLCTPPNTIQTAPPTKGTSCISHLNCSEYVLR